MKIEIKKSSQGIALIIVMLVILVLAALAGAFAYSMKVETTLARNANHEPEMEWMGRSGVEYARWILTQQANCPNEPFEALNQVWAGGSGGACSSNGPLAEIEREIQLGNGTITWEITDLERKFNINMAEALFSRAGYDVMEKAMVTIMGADASVSSAIRDAVFDWVDPDEDNHLSGAESDYYLSLDPPYVAKNGPIDDLSELLLLKGVFENPEIFWGSSSTNHPMSAFQARTSNRPFDDPLKPSYPVGLVDMFTTLSSGRININTASLTTLQLVPGVDESIAAGIIQKRSGLDGMDGTDDDDPFRSVAEIASVPGWMGNTQGLTQFCHVKSSTFEVKIEIILGGISRTYYAVLRKGTKLGEFAVLKFYWK